MPTLQNNIVQTSTIGLDLVTKIKSAFKVTLQLWNVWQQKRVERDAAANLLRLDERALKDIGLTKNDVHHALRLPLSENAGLELYKIRQERIRRR